MSIRNKNREVALNGKRNGSIPQSVTEYRSFEATETWVENRINATSAYYLTYNADGDAFPTYSDLVNASVYYSGGKPRTPTRNDYAIVDADETHGGARWRYIYGEAEDDSSETSESGEQETPWEPQYPITTGDYEELSNKPSINGKTIEGDKTGADYGLADLDEDGNIPGSNLAEGSVSSDKIADSAVTADKIGSGAVTADKVADGAITADKIDGSLTADIDGKRDKTDLAVYELSDYWEGTPTSGATVMLPLVSSSGYSKVYSNGSDVGCYQLLSDDYRPSGGMFRVLVNRRMVIMGREQWSKVTATPETSFDEITEVTTTNSTPEYTFRLHAEAVPEQDNFLATTKGMAGLLEDKVDKEDGKGLSTNDFTDDYKDALEGIVSAMPEDASDANPLADREWVDKQIDSLAAYYITMNAAGDAFATYDALVNASVYYSGGKPRTPTRNDYAIVEADETQGGARWRYIYGEEGGESSDSADSSESGELETPWEPQYPITTGDYEALDNKPSINGIEMSGDVTLTGMDIYMDSSQGAKLITVAIKGTDDKAAEALARADDAATKAAAADTAAAVADYKANQARTLAAAAHSSANLAREEAHAAQDTANHADAAAAAAQNTADQARREAAVADEKAVTALSQATQIEEKIPAQASSTNQLADKDFVNSSIATSTATFRGTSDAATLADFEAWLATLPADNNDYVFWKTVDSEGNTVYKRYKYSDADESHDSSDSDSSDEPLLGHWLFEYELNNSSFTAEQWAAINSGITRGEVERIADIVPSTQTPSMDGVGNAGTADSYARGDHVHPTDTSRASVADATLTEKWMPTFSLTEEQKEEFSQTPGASDNDYALTIVPYPQGEDYKLYVGSYSAAAFRKDPSNSTNLIFEGGDARLGLQGDDLVATWSGYQLGSQSDKPLASESEAEALRTEVAGKLDKSGGTMTGPLTEKHGLVLGKEFNNDFDGFKVDANGIAMMTNHAGGQSTFGEILSAVQDVPNKANRAANPTAGNLAALDAQGNPTDSGLSKDEVESLLFSQYYPDGSVKSAAEFTAGIKYDAPDTTNRTITVKPFCNTGTAANDNSSLVGRVVIPPFVDAQGNGYISDDGTRFEVVGVNDGSPHGSNTGLTAIITPTTVTSIDSQTFFRCTSLLSISLHSATNIGINAFFNCSSLTSVDFGDTPRSSVPTLGTDAFNGAPTSCKIIVPYTQYNDWIAADGWKDLPQEFVRHAEKSDKPATFTTGNLAKFDSNGNPTDSGKAPDDFLEKITVLDYGTSSWQDFLDAYAKQKMVYVRYKITGSNEEYRLGSLTYFLDSANPDTDLANARAEFLYHRSLSAPKDGFYVDQAVIYTLNKHEKNDKSKSWAWSVVTRPVVCYRLKNTGGGSETIDLGSATDVDKVISAATQMFGGVVKSDSSVSDLLPYALKNPVVEDGSATLSDRTCNYIDARALASSEHISINFPTLVDGKVRDFALVLECSEFPPSITWDILSEFLGEASTSLEPEEGLNVFAFTEMSRNKFYVSHKILTTLSPSSDIAIKDLISTMQSLGYDTSGMTTLDDVREALELPETATLADCLNAIRN